MKLYETVWVDSALYRLRDRSLAAGYTLNHYLKNRWALEEMVIQGILVPVEAIPMRHTATIKLDASIARDSIENITGCSKITAQLIEQIAARDAHGKKKYGTSLDRSDLSLTDWLQHQAEELMDGAGYALAAKREAEKLYRIRDAAQEVCKAAQASDRHHEVYEAIAKLHDLL